MGRLVASSGVDTNIFQLLDPLTSFPNSVVLPTDMRKMFHYINLQHIVDPFANEIGLV